MDLINICICTYKRNDLLSQCLNSLTRLQLSDDMHVHVTVIDNASDGHAETVIKFFEKKFSFPLHYHQEPRRGIPFVRNRAIDETIKLQSTFLVFIDDDEWVEPDWLMNLYVFCKGHGGSVVVSGRVISDLPSDVSSDIRGLFNKKSRSTGSWLKSCATDNVIIPVEIFKDQSLRFDVSRPLAGGTDTMFFCCVFEKGVPIIKCAEAVVHEIIPSNRLSLKWMCRRKYRSGITVAWRKKRSGRLPIVIAFSALTNIGFSAIKAAVFAAFKKNLRRNKCLLAVCRSSGILSGVMGKETDSYENTDGQ
ncbi:glycosyltransferase [uncultured Desulfuromusa sp.]|uniref:glycosyltransferase n=1 Tax=uncultured Desulfuromusa sp. TaxID=219183 RepID=UPI002AA86CAD|nr:glycosyltransferase [uncultured Desulfuromusa sp.]